MDKKILIITFLILICIFQISGQAFNNENDGILNENLSPAGYYTVEEFRKELQGDSDLVIYDINDENQSEYIILLKVDEEMREIKGYNIPFKEKISIETAEKIVKVINKKKIDQFIKFNVNNFLEVVDLYDEINIKTGTGYKEMNKKEIKNYLEAGIRENEFNRLGRQISFFQGLQETVKANNSFMKIPSLLSIMNKGYQKTETNMSRLQAISFGLKFARYEPENITIYFPEPDIY